MSLHQRKLLLMNNSFQISISQVCQPYCVDRTLNKDGFCPLLCISQCYQTCYRSLIPDLLPPPPPPPPPPPSPSSVSYHHHLSKSFGLTLFLIVSLAILATTFLVFFSYTVYKLFRQRRRQQREEEEGRDGDGDEERGLDFLDEEDHGALIDHPIWYIRTQGLQSSVINAITICKYKKGDGLIEGTDCAVCLNEFQEDETLRLLPKCNHAFHIPCIDTWLRSHTNCPMCRAGIVISSSARFQSLSVEEQQTLVREVSSSSSSSSRRDVENDELQEQVTIEVGDNRYSRDGIQPLRRSVSLDSLSASAMSSAIIDGRSSEDKQDLELNGTTRSSTSTNTTIAMAMSVKRADTNNQRLSKSSAGSSSSSSSMVMRSLSCSAKVFLSRYSRSNRISVVPLPRSFD